MPAAAAPSTSEWAALNGPEAPLLNRALQGFPPASTFKIVTSIAALESGIYKPDSMELTTGSFCYAGLCYRDHVSLGTIGFPLALAVSSNSFYYRAGLKIGPDPLFKAARQLGFGRATGVELEEEVRRRRPAGWGKPPPTGLPALPGEEEEEEEQGEEEGGAAVAMEAVEAALD